MTKKNGAIEFSRFVVILCVCIHHYCQYVPGGYLGVDFFFVLSGYLLMQHFCRHETEVSSIHAAIQYTKNRYCRIIPYYILAFVLSLILDACLGNLTVDCSLITNSFWEILMLEGFGFTENIAVGPGWYCSALIIAGFLIYTLLSYEKEIYVYCIAPFSLFIILAWMNHHIGHLNRWLQYDTFISTGVLRGYAEMGLGCMCYNISSLLKPKLERYSTTIISTLLEPICILYISYILIFKGETGEDFICVFVMSVLITSFFLENSLWVKLLENKLSMYLGEISISIYLNHLVIERIDWFAFLGMPWQLSFIIYLLIVIVFSAISTSFIKHVISLLKFYFSRRKTQQPESCV